MKKSNWGNWESIPRYVPAKIPAKIKLKNGSEHDVAALLRKAEAAPRTLHNLIKNVEAKINTRTFNKNGYDRALIIAQSQYSELKKMFPNFTDTELQNIQAAAQDKLKHRNNPYALNKIKVTKVTTANISE